MQSLGVGPCEARWRRMQTEGSGGSDRGDRMPRVLGRNQSKRREDRGAGEEGTDGVGYNKRQDLGGEMGILEVAVAQ